ncbi:MAG: hypothetical protein PHW76_07355 [Alphaproteobacteria bacterium]|nr:hypothetical protein [Alphaproteobacteria bacterium]
MYEPKDPQLSKAMSWQLKTEKSLYEKPTSVAIYINPNLEDIAPLLVQFKEASKACADLGTSACCLRREAHLPDDILTGLNLDHNFRQSDLGSLIVKRAAAIAKMQKAKVPIVIILSSENPVLKMNSFSALTEKFSESCVHIVNPKNFGPAEKLPSAAYTWNTRDSRSAYAAAITNPEGEKVFAMGDIAKTYYDEVRCLCKRIGAALPNFPAAVSLPVPNRAGTEPR